MGTLELDTSRNATTFNLEVEERFHDSFSTLRESLKKASKKKELPGFILYGVADGLQSTFDISEKMESVKLSHFEEDTDLDYDITVPVKVRKSYKMKVRIKSVRKHQPRIFFD